MQSWRGRRDYFRHEGFVATFPATILKRQIIALCAGKAAMAVLRDHKHDFGWKSVMTAEKHSANEHHLLC